MVVVLMLFAPSFADADTKHFQRAKVMEPFLEIHTGPGESYPVFYIAEKDEVIFLMKKRTDWFKVRLFKGQEGWAHRDEIGKTLRASGYKPGWGERFYERYLRDALEGGWRGGFFEDDPSLFVRLAYRLAEALSAEISLGKASGDLGDTDLYLAGVVLTPWTGRWFSVNGAMGGGLIKTAPAQLLVNAKSDRFETAYAGVGFSAPLLKRLALRGEFRHYTLFVSPKRNRAFQEMSLGLNFSF